MLFSFLACPVSRRDVYKRQEQQYSVYYNGELDDVFEDDTVEVTGLPLGTSSFENTEGGDTLVVVLAGCRAVSYTHLDVYKRQVLLPVCSM